MGIGIGFSLGPLRISTRGVRAGGSVGPVSASANLTPRIRAGKLTSTKPKKKEPRAKFDSKPQSLVAAEATLAAVTFLATRSTKQGRVAAKERVASERRRQARNFKILALLAIVAFWLLFIVVFLI